jgi:hypothetical protein
MKVTDDQQLFKSIPLSLSLRDYTHEINRHVDYTYLN